jgi:hypothetical protein
MTPDPASHTAGGGNQVKFEWLLESATFREPASA